MKLVVQASAEDDILHQFEWYTEQASPSVAVRREALSALAAMPDAGSPKHIGNLQLAGLRTWPVRGFDDFRIYYLARTDDAAVLRILHGKRDVRSILEGQAIEKPEFS